MNLVNEGVLPPDELDDRDERREEQESARSRETVADIVAAMRAMARVSETFVDRFSNPCLRMEMEMEAKMRKSLADRLEAAWKRDEEHAVEHATRHAEAVARDNCRDCVHNPRGKNYEGGNGGNAAAMREVLMRFLIWAQQDLWENACEGPNHRQLANAIVNEVSAALSAPPRQCDVGTPEEQGERCLAQFEQWRRNGDGKKLITAIMTWAQMPYKAQEGGAK